MRRSLIHMLMVMLTAFVLTHCHGPCHAPNHVKDDASNGPPTKTILKYRGTNLSGAEFGTAIPGSPGEDYQWPDPSVIEYFLAQGMNHVRVPFRHERLQPALQGALNEDEWSRLQYVVDYATGNGMFVTLVPYSSFRHRGTVLSDRDVADFWGRVAFRLKANPHVMLNVTNEPSELTTENVVQLNKVAVQEIRKVGFTGFILAPGNAWTSGGHWTELWYGTANSTLMNQVGADDPSVVFEVHQFLDLNANGGGAECVSADIGFQRLSPFTAWLRSNKRKGFLGAFGAPNTPTCAKAVEKLLTSIEKDGDIWLGWDWWGAGEWSYASTYPLSIGPSDPPKPQLSWLLPFLSTGAEVKP